ncbi:hypothetical protein [Streptomyces sp. NPDC047315]
MAELPFVLEVLTALGVLTVLVVLVVRTGLAQPAVQFVLVVLFQPFPR